MRKARLDGVTLPIALLIAGCSSTTYTNNSSTQGSGGVSPIGGNSSTAAGASAAVGGTSHTSGGSTGTVGTTASGGATATGTTTLGGTGPAAGASAVGGSSASTGGATSQGGTHSTGGSASSSAGSSNGGTSAVGGTTGTAPSSGGARTTGGAASTGGALATGGAISTGGAATGGAHTGGAVPTGGVPPTGGSSATGCTGSHENIVQIPSGKSICVAKMAAIPGPDAAQNYQIDQTEVTWGQYTAWVATSPALPVSTDANCSYVTSYAPQGPNFASSDPSHLPVIYVDWCDGYNYCRAVGKHLCGPVGGTADCWFSFYDVTANQSFRACTAAGAQDYPYGGAYQSDYCNDIVYGLNATTPVASMLSCVTTQVGYSGVFDLTGNVSEWAACCDPSVSGASGQCAYEGGAYDSPTAASCGIVDVSNDGNLLRNQIYQDLGFRCCAG